MSEHVSSWELKQVGENCSQYKPDRSGMSATMGISGENELSCATCRNWSGKRCIIDAFDNVAVNLGILPEDE